MREVPLYWGCVCEFVASKSYPKSSNLYHETLEILSRGLRLLFRVVEISI